MDLGSSAFALMAFGFSAFQARLIERRYPNIGELTDVGGLRMNAGDPIERQGGRGGFGLQRQAGVLEGFATEPEHHASGGEAAVRLGRGTAALQQPRTAG